MNFGSRLKKLRVEHNMTQLDLAQKLHLSKANISKYEANLIEPNLDTLTNTSVLFDVSVDYLLGKTDYSIEENYIICENISDLLEKMKNPPNPKNIMGVDITFNSIKKNEYQFTHESLEKFASYFGVSKSFLATQKKAPAKSNGIKIPVLGHVAAGIPIEAIEDIIDYEEVSADELNPNYEYFGLKIKGDSMSPRIQNGDVVIVRQQPDVDSGDVAIVRVNGDSATCKQIQKEADGILLIPFNPAYGRRKYKNEEIESLPVTILGKVVELRGKF